MAGEKALRNDSLLAKAIRFAAKAHRGQYRDGPAELPYITHPIDVVCHLRYVAGCTDEDILCAAALHDVLEETNRTIEEIEARFGQRVAGLVQGMTRAEPAPDKTEGMSEAQVWRLRNDMLLAEIDGMATECQLIKLADRCSNLRAAFATRTGEKLHRYQWQSIQILEIVDRALSPQLWDEINNMLGQASLPDGWTPPEGH